MSTYTLQKKSRRFKAPISGIGHNGFSLVGGHRNIGSVGPTNLAKSVTRTRFRGTAPMGNGGCCGQFKVVINNSGSCCTNDPSIIKKTVKNTKGAIIQQFPWIHSVDAGICCPDQPPDEITKQNGGRKFWVKVMDSMPENYSQSQYIRKLVAFNATCVVDKENSGVNDCGGDLQCKSASYHIGGKKFYRAFYSKNLTPYPTSCSEYLRSAYLRKNNIPPPPCLAPFPMVLNHNGCDVNYLTPEQAIADGALPQNWMNCNDSENPNCKPKIYNKSGSGFGCTC
jgi:hypothetical protein